MTAPTLDPILWANDTNWSSGPRSGSALKDTAMSAGVAAQGVVAGQTLKADQLNQCLNNFALWLTFHVNEQGRVALEGDASDGNATIAGGTTTLSRTMYYDTLTIEASGVIDVNGSPIYARRIINAGVIHSDGVDGGEGINDPNSGGAGGSSGFLGAGGVGGEAHALVAGTAALAVTEGGGGAGGTGGTAGGSAGGAGAAVSSTAGLGGWRHGTPILRDGTPLQGGGGGGGGGSDIVTYGGGGGGGGGGVVFISCGSLDNTGGVIRANGGAGGSGRTDAAGGGGGGGGVVFINYRALIAAGAMEALGGAAGPAGTGIAGLSAGSAGTVLQFVR